jgi:hypothetical protein
MRTERDAVHSSLNCVAFTGSPEQTTQHVGIIVVQIHIYNVNKMYNTQKCVLYIYIYMINKSICKGSICKVQDILSPRANEAHSKKCQKGFKEATAY